MVHVCERLCWFGIVMDWNDEYVYAVSKMLMGESIMVMMVRYFGMDTLTFFRRFCVSTFYQSYVVWEKLHENPKTKKKVA